MNSFAIHTPQSTKKAVELSRHIFRKQILPKSSINYKGRKIEFSDAYLTELAKSYKDGAFDAVTFQLAGDDSGHTANPERTRGTVKEFEVTPTGLDAILELTDEGAQIVRDNPKLGVSARIVERLERADGKFFNHAIEHVLGTLTPRVTGMRAWEPIALSNTDLEVLDLSDETFEKKGAKMADKDAPTIGDDDRKKFDAYITELASLDPAKVDKDGKPVTTTASTAATTATTTGTDDIDAELEALLTEALESETVGGAELSAESRSAIELANATAEEARSGLATVQAQLDLSNFEHERDAFLAAGVPPAVVELSMPLLLGANHVIDLSNGSKADAGEIIRQVLKEFEGTVDLSGEHPAGQGTKAADEATALLDAWETQHPTLTKS